MKEPEIHAGQRESVRDILDENDAYDMQMYGRIVDKPVHVSKCCEDGSCMFCEGRNELQRSLSEDNYRDYLDYPFRKV